MDPIFFGEAKRQLFGAYHSPPTAGARSVGVLLCYPSMQEYLRSHFAFRKLAAMLARKGFHVLRFDYFGTGDSMGESTDGTVDDWVSDIRQAAAELKDVAGVRRVSIVGLRLGAALAARAASEGLAVRDLVLWDPVVNGRDHLRELRAVHERKLPLYRTAPRVGPDEVLGYAVSPTLTASLESLDLATLPPCTADRILVFAGSDRPQYASLKQRLRDRQGRPPRFAVVADEAGTRDEGVMLSTRILEAMTTAVAEEATS